MISKLLKNLQGVFSRKITKNEKYQKAQSVKKVFAFKSVQNAFEKHSETVRKTVRKYVTFYVKQRDFQDLKWHDFVFLQGKALRGVKKRSVRIGKTVPEPFFS